jgi:hypothetical protein
MVYHDPALGFANLHLQLYKRFMTKNNGEKRPEYRAPLMMVGAVFVPVGLFWYGWSLQAKLHWIMPNVSFGPFMLSTSLIKLVDRCLPFRYRHCYNLASHYSLSGGSL